MMKRGPAVFIAGMVLLAVVLLTTAPAAAVDTGRCTRPYNIVLELSPSGVTEQAVQVVYGSSPHPADAPGSLTGKVIAADGRTLQEFPLWGPRIQFGEDIVVDEHGNITKIAGISRRESRTTLAVMFTYSVDAASFDLYEGKSTLTKSVDLTKAENRATWNCTPEYGIPPRARTRGGGFPGSLPMLLPAGVILAGAAAGAVRYFYQEKEDLN